jgi:CBS domain-containing protein
MKVSDLMLPVLFKCRESDPIDVCARIMRDEKIGFVPVVDVQGRVRGVVTDRDVALRVVAENRPTTTVVRDVMSPGPFVSAKPEEDLRSLEDRLAKQRKSRALVLNESGQCIGVISLSDIALSEDPRRSGNLLRQVSSREVHVPFTPSAVEGR